MVRNSVFYWPGVGNKRNFGDFLAEFLLDELFVPVPVKGKGLFIIGSCIDDLFFSEPTPPVEEGSIEDRLVFWGCGMRTPTGLSEKNRQRCEILAVRGPLTRSALRLGESVPIGDSAMFLPALYQPAPSPEGGTLCVPHFHDSRNDDELLAQSGCAAILRPNLPESRQSLLSFIDRIVSAEFVLTASLHGAVVAAAYGRPFAFWENEHLDLPFKWEDFAASISVPHRFAKTLSEGRRLYDTELAPKLRLPALWPFLATAPLGLRAEAALKVLRHELRRGADPALLERSVEEFVARQHMVGDLSGHHGSAARDWVSDAIAREKEDLQASYAHAKKLGQLAEELKAQLEEQSLRVEQQRQEAAARDAELRALTDAASAQASRLAEVEARNSGLEQARRLKLLDRKRPRTVRVPFLRHRVPLHFRTLIELARLRTGDALLLAGSPLFDAAWYAIEYPDVVVKGIHPLRDYLLHGAWEGRDPSSVFDSDYYLSRHPDVVAAKENPLCHYLRHGVAHNLFPNAEFDPAWYLASNPDVRGAGLDPLAHYLLYGMAEGRRTHAGSGETDGGLRPLDNPAPQPKPVALAGRAISLPASVANRDGPRMLIADSVYPRPDRDSGSVTMRYLIEIFLELGWQVTFFGDAEMGDSNRYGQQLERLGVRVLRQPPVLDAFLRAEGGTLALAMLFRVYSGGRHYEAVRRHCPDAKIVFETVDLHFLREEREAQLHRDQRALNLSRATRERELHVARSSDLAIVVSEFELELLEREVPGVRAMTLPLILECPGRSAPFSARHGVAFIGGYLHKPNIDAVEYFLDAIWPEVLERLPTCVFHIVGSDLPEALKKRASKSVVPVGYLEDLDGFLGKVRLTVAPLRYGAGVKGKVGSSLAAGVPCVGTSIAAEGMGPDIGKAIVVADDPVQFAERIVALHEDAAPWTRISDDGWTYASEQFSLGAARRRMVEMLARLGLPVREAGISRKAGAV
jgi:glycosyltransferase involved in cell wall biosynthesis